MNSNLKLKQDFSDLEIQSEEALKCSCVECGTEVISYNKIFYPAYCQMCKPIKNIKETWKPLGSGKVSRIFVIPSKKLEKSVPK